MRTAFIEALCAVAEQDERVWLLSGDLGYSVLERFASRYPQRYVNVGVAEQNLAGIAAGLALSGRIVFMYSIANFPVLRCLEQVRNDICYHQLNVKIAAVGGGQAYGPAGYSHHAIEDLAVMRALPGMTVVAPGDPVETRLATAALAHYPGPCYLRLGKAQEPVVHATVPEFTIGRAITLRTGTDLTLISTGGILSVAHATAEHLAAEGISVRLLSLHTLAPLDVAAIQQCARETKTIITVEEHRLCGGLGSAVAEVLAEMGSPVRLRRVAVQDQTLTVVGGQPYLRNLSRLSVDGLLAAIHENGRLW